MVRMSVAPIFSRASITVAARSFSTSAETATQLVSSRFITEGERLPGVILVACGRKQRAKMARDATTRGAEAQGDGSTAAAAVAAVAAASTRGPTAESEARCTLYVIMTKREAVR